MGYYLANPSAYTSWRLAVLMGANSRTYKFALGQALLHHARLGREDVPLRELAVPYAMSMVEHLEAAPQASEALTLGENDFLAVARAESAASRQVGAPTERLLDAAVASMPAMVMTKFHNLRGDTKVPHEFYSLTGTPRHRLVRLTSALQRIAASEQTTTLAEELQARWSIVELSFTTGIGRSLIHHGVAVDIDTYTLTDKTRRRAVTGVAEAVVGFQEGRCLICDTLIGPDDEVAVDHVFPFALMDRKVIEREHLDLDAVWNLAPAHRACNSDKSDRLPTLDEIHRLADRNGAIMNSPHPLRKALALTLASRGYAAKPVAWRPFLTTIL